MSFIDIPLAGGITIGTTPVTSGTAGSVLFIGSGGVVQQDNANLFWDDTSNCLGIGTNSLGACLDVKSTGSATIVSRFRAAVSQSANIAEWQNSAGTALVAISATGQLGIGTNSWAAPLNAKMAFTTSAIEHGVAVQHSATNPAATVMKVIAPNTSTNATTLFSVSNATVSGIAITGDGKTFFGANVGVGNSDPQQKLVVQGGHIACDGSMVLGSSSATPGAKFEVIGTSSSAIQSIIKGAASQSVALTEWQNSSGTALSGVDAVGQIGAGTATPATMFESQEVKTITGAVTDGYSAALTLDPGYTAATAQTVTRHNYIDVQNVSNAGDGPSAVTDACVMRFDAAAGTHKATASGTTKTTPGTVDAWVKININGTIHYIPAYTSTTA